MYHSIATPGTSNGAKADLVNKVYISKKVAQRLVSVLQVDLPAQLSVDLVHCERAAQQAVAESNGALRLLQAELFTTAYFDNLAAEVDEVLQVGNDA